MTEEKLPEPTPEPAPPTDEEPGEATSDAGELETEGDEPEKQDQQTG